jgi:hypothetical protein
MTVTERALFSTTVKLVVFALLLSLAYVAVVAVAANVGPTWQAEIRTRTNIPVGVVEPGGSSLVRFREIEEFADVDIVFVGSSHCYRAFDPRIFESEGLSVFNMGSTSQTPLNSYFLLRRHLERLDPDLLVVEVYWEVLQWDGLESYLDLSQNLPLSRELASMALATRNVRAVNALLVRLTDAGREPIAAIEPVEQPNDRYVRGGFVEKKAGSEGLREIPDRVLRIDRLQRRYLDRTAKLSRARGIPAVFVSQPLPRQTKQRFLNLAEMQRQMHAIAERRGVTFLDFEALMDLEDPAFFYDYHHLNQAGVERFNRRLIAELRDRGLLPRARREESR